MIIQIVGTSAAGKSTLVKALQHKFGEEKKDDWTISEKVDNTQSNITIIVTNYSAWRTIEMTNLIKANNSKHILVLLNKSDSRLIATGFDDDAQPTCAPLVSDVLTNVSDAQKELLKYRTVGNSTKYTFAAGCIDPPRHNRPFLQFLKNQHPELGTCVWTVPRIYQWILSTLDEQVV